MNEPRVIRVFVSSTFSDMHAERDELIKRVFPRLRKLCEQRGVVWGEVDLRWGVTDEQRAEGQVLPICLEEIYKCRPYFIGLLGERYGWVPDSITEELLEREPWLREQLANKKSVTELEILHGVLNNPDMAKHAFFYFRDPAYLERLPSTEDRTKFVCENAIDVEKLHDLKTRIKSSPFPVRENYPDPVTLGEWIEQDLTTVIDDLYPAGSEPTPLDRDAAEHESFAQSRARVYIPRREYFAQLDAHADGNGPPLVVLGESGLGKSALLANWALHYRSEHPNAWLLMHFIGGTPYSADWAAMLRRILGEFNQRFDLGVDIPDKPDALRATFANALHMAAARGRIILVLDALNQLEDSDGALDLVWLPPVVPENVRLIVSTLPGRPLDDLTKRGWSTLTVEPLSIEERRTLIADYLAQYRKSLSPTRVERIAAAEQTKNPLFLRALLEELRVFGVHEELDRRIDGYLGAFEIDDLFELILARYEDDYERDRPGLVRAAMTLLWAARRGLTQSELLALLGEGGEPLQQAYWSPLHLAADHALVDRSGLFGFAHDYIRKAVEDRYLPSENMQTEAHLRLATYFEQNALEPRAIDELPWQFAEAKAWPRLAKLLAQVDFFQAAWNANEFEVKAYWARIETGSPLRIVEVYRGALDMPQQFPPDFVWLLSSMLGDLGKPVEAMDLRTFLVDHFRQSGDKNRLLACLGNKAVSLYTQGDLDGAMALHKEEESLCREQGHWLGFALTLGNQANILSSWGDLDGALACYKKQERLCRELNYKKGVAGSLSGQAWILGVRGDLDGATALEKEDERLCRELGDKEGLADSLNNQAGTHYRRGDFAHALALYKESERLDRELGNKRGLANSLNGQGVIFMDLGDLEGSMALYKEEEHLCRELGNKEGLQVCLGNQALILKKKGDLNGAMTLCEEQEYLCRALGIKDGLCHSLGVQALILYTRGDIDGAMVRHKEQERLCRELNNIDSLIGSLNNQARILSTHGNPEAALLLYKEAEELCRELDNKKGLQSCLGGQALILKARGDLESALALCKEQECLCRESGIQDGLADSLGNQAGILYAQGIIDSAMALYKEAECLCRELGDKVRLQRTIGNQAAILSVRGDFGGAMDFYKEQETLCRELGSKESLKQNLGYQAYILHSRAEFESALALYKEQELLCRELDDREGLADSLARRSLLLAGELGQPQEAKPLAEEAESIVMRHGLSALADKIRPIVEYVRGMNE